MIDKRKWFDVPDSLVEREDGNSLYYNVEARFADHPVLNGEKTRVARSNVYDIGMVLHTRVKRAGGDAAAIKNMSAQVLRFDKGEDRSVITTIHGPNGPMPHRGGDSGMSKEDYVAAVKAITRCGDAWQHYQLFRKSPVTVMEQKALKQIMAAPEAERPKGVLVDVGGTLERMNFDPDAEIDDETLEEEARISRSQVIPKPKKAKRIEKAS
jgi:hypothetical protein